jgi:glycosyltransferase involved in cell wall biosynthesis
VAHTLKRRILHLIGSFDQGGSERQAIQLVRALQESDRYEVYLACLKSSGVLRANVDSFFAKDIPAYPLTSFYDTNALRQARQFRKFLRQNKIEIVQTHDFYTNVFGMAVAALAGVRIRIAARRELTGIRTRAQLRVEHAMYVLADAIVANSSAVGAQLVREGIRPDKVITIPNGIEMSRFPAQLSKTRENILTSLKLPRQSEALITIVANMRFPVKDHPTFLQAARIVHQARPQVAFALAGEGELRNQLIALAAELGLSDCAFFLDDCSDVAELLSVSDICVLSSRAEGMPNAILEYMAAGRPVVATNVGGAGELIRHGDSGFLVDAGDHRDLAARILQLLADPRRAREMGSLARKTAAEEFSVAAQLRRTEQLYDRLLQSKGSPGS